MQLKPTSARKVAISNTSSGQVVGCHSLHTSVDQDAQLVVDLMWKSEPV